MVSDGQMECRYCGNEYQQGTGIRTHQTSMHPEEVATSVPCNWCGSDVEVYEWQTGERQYCTRECAYAWTAFINSGENHHSYENGKSRSRGFRHIASGVRLRDGECRVCGKQSATKDDRSLHVHHITPEDETDSPHRPTNLISLCASCHRKMEGKPPATQLEACDIESRDELSLPEDVQMWVETLDGNTPLESAPTPRMGMFEEAQRHLSERENNA